MELEGQWTAFRGWVSRKKVQRRYKNQILQNLNGSQQAPAAWWELFWRTKQHSFSLTQIKTVWGQFSSAAPAMFNKFLTLSHQKENNRTENVLTTLLSSSSHFPSPYLCWHFGLGAQGLPALIHRQESHLFQHISKKPSTSHSNRNLKSF